MTFKLINLNKQMKSIQKVSFLFLVLAVSVFCFGGEVLAQNPPQVQTISATTIQNNSATLNANITYLGDSGNPTVYFQWGNSISYGYQTPVVTQNYTGNFSQMIYNLTQNTTYHFRVVAQNNYGTVYGQDMTFNNNQSGANMITVNAGTDLYLTSGQTVTLQGSGYSSNGYSLNYSWSCSGGNLSSYSIAQPVYTAPYSGNYNNQTTYTCTLMVSDSYGNSNSDSMIVYMNSNGNNNYSSVQTTYATYVSNFQATLNGVLSNYNSYNNSYNNSSTNYVYFQWGTTTNYGSETPQQSIGSSQSFMQNIENLNSGTLYHFRAVAQGNNGLVYGQDMTFTTSGAGNGYYGSTSFSATKQVIDLTSGNLNWSTSISASPSDILSFSITLQAGNQDVHNVVVRDILPANLIYKGNLMVNTSPYGGDITSGINIGTISSGQVTIISYRAQVANAINFSFGATTINNNATITSNESGTQTSAATVVVNKALVYGASTVSTGLTNNFLTDSFFLPLLTILAGLWLYFSGSIYHFADWLKGKK